MRDRRRIENRVSDETFEELRKAAARHGFSSVNKLLHAAVAAELRHGESALVRTEQNIVRFRQGCVGRLPWPERARLGRFLRGIGHGQNPVRAVEGTFPPALTELQVYLEPARR
jgi:hypothetical protein